MGDVKLVVLLYIFKIFFSVDFLRVGFMFLIEVFVFILFFWNFCIKEGVIVKFEGWIWGYLEF